MEEIKNEAAENEAKVNTEAEECAATETEKEAKKEEKSEAKAEKKTEKKQKSRIKELEAALAAAEEKTKEAEDKYLRLAAEYDNFRKRSKAERDSIYAEAAADAVKELLPVFDNLERATQYDADKVAEGVELILKGLPDVFAKMKITVYGKAGEQFDPNIHNAVMHIEDEAYGENEIVDVFQQGYMLGDKVVRYAMVRVAN